MLNLISLTSSGSLSNFLNRLFEELRNGIFLFTSPWDIFISALDIFITTLVLYYLLRVISETRAWQLLKGLMWIAVFAVLASALGFNSIYFILTNSLSLLAVGLVVIFQPELRRALETVGRNSSHLFSTGQDSYSRSEIHQIVESIVQAAAEMAEEKTGALIVIERQTRLRDIIESSDLAVVLDADLSSTALRQIFFNNSPLHDGAVIVRGRKIVAARVHVPLSDSYRVRQELGTRHRAALGVSEIGDPIAVVVSEERGSISVAVNGRLYTLADADDLHTVLHRLLIPDAKEEASMPRRLRKLLRRDRTRRAKDEAHEEEQAQTVDEEDQTAEFLSELDSSASVAATYTGKEVTDKPRQSKSKLIVIALAISIGVSLYVRVTTNYVLSRTFTLNLQTVGLENLERQQLDYYKAESQVVVTIRGRKRNIEDLDPADITAVIDFSEVQGAGAQSLPVQVNIADLSNLTYQVSYRNPDKILVNVFQQDELGD